jgi:hypothetical protein
MGEREPEKPTFPTGIHDHQNNSFDEFRERGYARAHYERCGALKRQERAGIVRSHLADPRNEGSSFEKNSGRKSSQLDAGRRPGLLCDSDKA